MRLENFEKKAIISAIKQEDPEVVVYLFGSRVDDKKLGCDIDILVFSSKINFDGKLRIKKKIFESLEEHNIDLIIVDYPADFFSQMAMAKGLKLA